LTHWNGLQLRTAIICFLLSMLDGADVLVVSFVAPVLTKQWGISDVAFGLVFSAGLAGMTLGALFLAPFADIWGRKRMILLSTLVITVGMTASGWAQDIVQLVALRVWTGLGIGAMLASITALSSEYAPDQFRPLAVTLVTAGYPVGATLAGLAAGYVIPAFGWEAIFILIGLASALMAPLVAAALPESTEFLIARQPASALARVNRYRLNQGKQPMSGLPPVEFKTARLPIARLMSPDLRIGTLLIWGAFFASFFTVYFLTSWVPKIAVQAGYSLPIAVNGSAVFNLGAFFGLVLLGWCASRMNLATLISLFFLLAAVAMILFGLRQAPLAIFYSSMLIMGFLIQGGFGGLYAIATQYYPAAVKTTGVGWAIGVGRLGAVAGPAIGGIVLSSGISLFLCFLLFAIPMLLAAVLTWLVAAQPASKTMPMTV